MEPSNNTTKYVVAIIIIALVIIGISLSARNKQKPNQDESFTNETAILEDATNATSSEPTINPAVAEIDYTIENGFTPDNITIKVGDTVKFVNKSSAEMWVASAMHPDHVVYSGTTLKEHCPDTTGVAFDQCQVGAEYSFTFTKIGTWAYHNHQNARMFGKVNVTEN